MNEYKCEVSTQARELLSSNDSQLQLFCERITATIAEIGRVSAEIGARSAVDALHLHENELPARQAKKAVDSRLHNTRLLLSQYRTLKEHCREAVLDKAQLLEHAEDGAITMLLDSMNEDFFLNSVLHSTLRTQLLLTHVEKMLNVYRISCKNSRKPEEKRRWIIIRSLYIQNEPLTIEQLETQLDRDRRTIYRDRDAAITSISALLFGASDTLLKAHG